MKPVPPISTEAKDSLKRDASGPVYNVSAVSVAPHPDGPPALCLRLSTDPGNASVHFALSPEVALRLARDLREAARRCLGGRRMKHMVPVLAIVSLILVNPASSAVAADGDPMERYKACWGWIQASMTKIIEDDPKTPLIVVEVTTLIAA